MKKSSLSVVVIAKNEGEFIKDCLESVRWADEIVLLDGGSTDQTVAIARQYGARIVPQKTKVMDFAAWHNQGKEEVKNKWLLYLDADEQVTADLRKEMEKMIKRNDNLAAYAMPRRNFLLGQELKYGGWYPDYQIRLFKKDRLVKWEGRLHERPVFEGRLDYLNKPMIHLTHRSLSTMVEKTKKWSEIEASLLFRNHHPPMVWWRILRMMISEFFWRFGKQQAWRDRTVGWIEGVFQVFNRSLIYIRLWELQKKKWN
jgi:glycosyltransferase involved in cell wall biosynthesis